MTAPPDVATDFNGMFATQPQTYLTGFEQTRAEYVSPGSFDGETVGAELRWHPIDAFNVHGFAAPSSAISGVKTA